MTVYAYSRLTDLECEDEQLTNLLESESLALQTYCLGKGWFVTDNLSDRDCRWDISLEDRPQGKALLAALREGDVMVCASLERLCSSSAEVLDLLSNLTGRGVALHIVDLAVDVTSPESHFSFVEAAKVFAGLESRRAAERIRGVKRKQRAKGRYLGGTRPFGYSVHENGKLIENPTEQRTLEHIVALKQQGKSLRAISAAVSTPLTPISFKTVQRVLQRIDA